jgi:hypothetical protein
MDPCRTTQHCTVHGFCERCDPDTMNKARYILAALRTQLDSDQVTRAYNDLSRTLTGREPERCIHTRAMHDRHHPFHHPAPSCPWCTEKAAIR